MAQFEFKPRNVLAFPWIVDNHSLIRTTGANIDWATMQGDQGKFGEYLDDETGLMVIPAGTIMTIIPGETQIWMPVAEDIDVSSLNDWGMIESDAYEQDMNAALDNYGILKGAFVYKNLLPDWIAGRTTLVASINGRQAFMLDTYTDSRAA